MEIEYRLNHPVTLDEFLALLESSTLAERRPVENKECMQGMLDNTNLTYTAWLEGKLVGMARCLTDFHYCTYLSDLAVDISIQHSGIGKKLVDLCAAHTPYTCKMVLLASPAANDYYPKIGMQHMDRCWILNGGDSLIADANKDATRDIYAEET